MSVLTLQQLPQVKLVAHAVAVPALSSHVRPALVLAERETRDLLEEASRQDVSRGGRFSAGPAGIQVWTGPFDGPNGAHGNAMHLGSIDWSYDTPVRHYATVYRAMVTQAGVEAGWSTETILRTVLELASIPLQGSHITMATPPPRDPFRHGGQLGAP